MTLKLNGSSAGSVSIDAPADTSPSGTDVTLTLPVNDGNSGEYLQTDGSGALSWAAQTEYQGPLARGYKSGSGSTSISASTWTKMVLDAESYDTDSCFDSTTNYRFTPTKAGYYVVTGQVFTNWTGSQFASSQVAIRKNGAEIAKNQRIVSTGTSDYGGQFVHHVVDMNGSSDYLELWYWSNASGPTYTHGESNTYMFSYWVREL